MVTAVDWKDVSMWWLFWSEATAPHNFSPELSKKFLLIAMQLELLQMPDVFMIVKVQMLFFIPKA